MKIRQAYKFALDPTPAQERMLRSHAGAARFAYNWGLAKCQERYDAERKWYSAIDLHKLWNAEKKTNPGLAWWAENSKCAYQEAFRKDSAGRRDAGHGGPLVPVVEDVFGMRVSESQADPRRNLPSLAASGAERLTPAERR